MGVEKEVLLPDIGDFESVEVIEVLIATGDRVEAEESLIVLESEKASMEIPSPFAGVVKALKVAVGDQVSQGALLAILETDDDATDTAESASGSEPRSSASEITPAPEAPRPAEPPEVASVEATSAPSEAEPASTPSSSAIPPGASEVAAHASPAVRRLARELGVDLRLVPGTGSKGRIQKEDVERYVTSMIAKGTAAGVPIAGVSVLAPIQFDFSKYGPTEKRSLNRVRKLASANLHRSWVTVPHVTQFDEADITELDAFRRQMKPEAESRDIKLTFLPFVLKACTFVLAELPHFNASLDHTGENLIVKQYYNIGVAVETENGLVVPIVRGADKKGLYQIAADLMEISGKARARRLHPDDLQGGTFSISSLGGIGGTFFTPIVNHPEVAILGVGRMEWKPVLTDGEFVPRLILPLSLSYDHRVVDGADAARFTTRISELLSDLRRLIL